MSGMELVRMTKTERKKERKKEKEKKITLLGKKNYPIGIIVSLGRHAWKQLTVA